MVDFEIKEHYDINDFRRIMEVLRAPGGCPWDAEQTHESIRNNVLEEAYEVADAIDRGDLENLREELGDLLMQVIYHARIEEERGSFDLNDVADAACKKLVYRHPHVFGDVTAENSEQVLKTWDEKKRTEKNQKTVADAMESVAGELPALWRAEKMQKKAAATGFEWPDESYAVLKIREETQELSEALEANDEDNIEEELGDLLFAAVKVARFRGIDPEKALNRACAKFVSRFRFMEAKALEKGECFEKLPLKEKEVYYQQARSELEGKKMQFLLDK